MITLLFLRIMSDSPRWTAAVISGGLVELSSSISDAANVLSFMGLVRMSLISSFISANSSASKWMFKCESVQYGNRTQPVSSMKERSKVAVLRLKPVHA